jgi:hypothetical protein
MLCLGAYGVESGSDFLHVSAVGHGRIGPTFDGNLDCR